MSCHALISTSILNVRVTLGLFQVSGFSVQCFLRKIAHMVNWCVLISRQCFTDDVSRTFLHRTPSSEL